MTLPRLSGFDHTLSLRREGYAFIPRRCNALRSNGFRARLMMRDVVCLRGAEASALLYGPAPVTRVDAMPRSVLGLLQDVGSVQQLDGLPHLHRKQIFIDLLMPDERVSSLVDEFRTAWRDALARWEEQGEIILIDALNPVITSATCRWVGLDLDESRIGWLASRLFQMSDRTGHVGPSTWAALAKRRRVERWLRDVVRKVRSSAIRVSPDKPLAVLTRAIDSDGQLLGEDIAAVELLNILRPTVAVGRFIVFAALALHEHPAWAEKFRTGDLGQLGDFAEEVRRVSPFFPFVGCVLKEDQKWQGELLRTGQWVLLDLFGTLHDPALFSKPDAFRPDRHLSWESQDHRFIPQGGGETQSTHRCPGERITVALMKEAIRLLCQDMSYEIAPQDLQVRLNRIPSQPESGLKLSRIRRTSAL